MFVHRPVVMGTRGMVVAGNHLAADAGAQVLRDGGNAMDACVTAAAVLAVTIPFMNGLGGDAFALWYGRDGGEVSVVNGSGGVPALAAARSYRALGHRSVPQRGPLSVSVPGAVRAWEDSLARFGTISLDAALGPAAELAARGFPLDRVVCTFLGGEVYADLCRRFPALARVFGAAGVRRAGEFLRQPALARTLETLRRDGADALYGGEPGRALAADAEAQQALLRGGDLEAHRTLFQSPLHLRWHGLDVLAAPPNTQGIAFLVLLGLLAADTGGGEAFLARFLRLKRIAFAQRDRHAGDPRRVPDPQGLLSPRGLRELLAEAPGVAEEADQPAGGDTTTVVAVDARGNAVSWVQSLFEEFGSGLVSESTGIVLQNRLHLASLDDAAPNGLAPGRRPFHTLCPALVLDGTGCRLCVATPGDHGQPQTLAQVMVNLFERGLDIQEAIELPRIRHDRGPEVMHESRLPAEELEELRDPGYRLRDVGPWSRLMGGVNGIYSPDGRLRMGGADPRRASYAVAQ